MNALVIVDMQNDFMPGGALGVPTADEIIPIINALIPKFSLAVATQDWHPPDHVSFASNHPGKKVGEIIRIGDRGSCKTPRPRKIDDFGVHCQSRPAGSCPSDETILERDCLDIDQILWPVHCVRNTHGAELASSINKDNLAGFFYKGTDKNIDSYSVFFDNARRKSTGLGDYLKSRGVNKVYLAGVATDYCVFYSTMDAIDLGFNVYVIADACRAINLNPRDEQRAFEAMAAKGAKIVMSSEL